MKVDIWLKDRPGVGPAITYFPPYWGEGRDNPETLRVLLSQFLENPNAEVFKVEK